MAKRSLQKDCGSKRPPNKIDRTSFPLLCFMIKSWIYQATRGVLLYFTPQSRQPLAIRSSGLDRNLTQDVEIQVVILVARGGKEVQGTHEFLLGLRLSGSCHGNEVRNLSEAEKILINSPTIIGIEWMLGCTPTHFGWRVSRVDPSTRVWQPLEGPMKLMPPGVQTRPKYIVCKRMFIITPSRCCIQSNQELPFYHNPYSWRQEFQESSIPSPFHTMCQRYNQPPNILAEVPSSPIKDYTPTVWFYPNSQCIEHIEIHLKKVY